MPNMRTPRGITPPAPGLEREEPTFVPERDIPEDDSPPAARNDRGAARDDRALRSPERK